MAKDHFMPQITAMYERITQNEQKTAKPTFWLIHIHIYFVSLFLCIVNPSFQPLSYRDFSYLEGCKILSILCSWETDVNGDASASYV